VTFRIFDAYDRVVSQIRIKDAARYLGVSDDTVRRWIDNGVLGSAKDGAGRAVVDGLELARLAQQSAVLPEDPSDVARSARNRFVGLVTAVTVDTVMAQVELQCGPHRVVSLISSEAVRELGLEPGSVAIAVIKATNVMVETAVGRA
jgi:molybdopterin-binding protein